ncbi:hypothetical protein [Paenibacillus mendelii]|uniref:Uncharacterized protein n=1 Tax=Paenibacillus mendelii TaxID=206163 RepID=A0ABV6J293_9BACL|nr:hypothetical protein [Paenibacillus mendelii]MCQ6560523.1 hypothetical protein [Paenibacillus mendelii]
MSIAKVEYPMVRIPAGEIQLRDDRIKTTWTAQVNALLLAPLYGYESVI